MKLEALFQFFLINSIAFYGLLLVDYWFLNQLWWKQNAWYFYACLLLIHSWIVIVFVWKFLHERFSFKQSFALSGVILYTVLSVALTIKLSRPKMQVEPAPVAMQMVEILDAPVTNELSSNHQFTEIEVATLAATPTAISAVAKVTPLLSSTAQDSYSLDPILAEANWGEAVKVSDTGYRMKVGFDERMATVEETFQALNTYRYTKGKSNLTWDGRLAKYALERAEYICVNGSDGHAGFDRYVNEEEGYKTLGFYKLGENMSTYIRLTGVHLIEWMYAASPSHNANQLGDWSHVGVGISGDCSVLIFGNWMI